MTSQMLAQYITSQMSAKRKILVVCLSVVVLVLVHISFLNVHLSKVYIQYHARLYPANITISKTCSWTNNKSFNFEDYKPESFILISRMFHITYKRHGIIPIIRDGSFLHTFRQLSADIDMDMFLIIPRNTTLWDAYSKIRSVINSDSAFQNITFETQNILISGIFFDKSDAARISFNGRKIVDINVLHETFLNDPKLQAPCLKQMHCKPLHDHNDPYIRANSHHITTKNLFESLCECNYMDSSLFCFDMNGAKYLEIMYGRNFTRRIPGDLAYRLIFERPHTTWRNILTAFPSLMNLKGSFEGHVGEENKEAFNITEIQTEPMKEQIKLSHRILTKQ